MHKDLDMKIQNSRYAYQSYQHILNSIKDVMRSAGNFEMNALRAQIVNVDNYVTDTAQTVDKFMKKSDEKFATLQLHNCLPKSSTLYSSLCSHLWNVSVWQPKLLQQLPYYELRTDYPLPSLTKQTFIPPKDVKNPYHFVANRVWHDSTVGASSGVIDDTANMILPLIHRLPSSLLFRCSHKSLHTRERGVSINSTTTRTNVRFTIIYQVLLFTTRLIPPFHTNFKSLTTKWTEQHSFIPSWMSRSQLTCIPLDHVMSLCIATLWWTKGLSKNKCVTRWKQ